MVQTNLDCTTLTREDPAKKLFCEVIEPFQWSAALTVVVSP